MQKVNSTQLRMFRKLALFIVLFYALGKSKYQLAWAEETTTPDTQGVYDTKFDNVDIDEILTQERLLKHYVKCLENKGPCTPDARMLKETLPDAIATNCAKCSRKQKYGSEKVTHYLIDHHPEDWARLEKIYDPQGNYKIAYINQKNLSETTTASTVTMN